ncbi:hypothetical protein [Microcoleus sp. CAWBG58]|uniref:hypothetical protein n=1 Tax=Microcoleus sp. CAWBG58 TaxID=2841651 RepID=UPI0025ED92E1|nr:hypothetical protein [Microcoleus sp. CAWBG58]
MSASCNEFAQGIWGFFPNAHFGQTAKECFSAIGGGLPKLSLTSSTQFVITAIFTLAKYQFKLF